MTTIRDYAYAQVLRDCAVVCVYCNNPDRYHPSTMPLIEGYTNYYHLPKKGIKPGAETEKDLIWCDADSILSEWSEFSPSPDLDLDPRLEGYRDIKNYMQAMAVQWDKEAKGAAEHGNYSEATEYAAAAFHMHNAAYAIEMMHGA